MKSVVLCLSFAWSHTAAAQDKWVEEGGAALPEGTTTAKLMAQQEPLLEVADALLAAGFEEPGYGAIELDVAGNAVRLYWDASERVADPVQRAIDEAAQSGVHVDVIASPFSNAELMTEVKNLAEVLSGSLVSVGPVGAHGVRLTVPYDQVSITEASSEVKEARLRLEEVASTDGSQGVVVEGSAPIILAASREADTPPGGEAPWSSRAPGGSARPGSPWGTCGAATC